MKILVINGDCIQRNSSANLCHLAYIQGLLDAGHDVTLLSADGRDYVLDEAMTIPKNVKQYTYYGVSWYEKFSLLKRNVTSVATGGALNDGAQAHTSGLRTLIRKAKSAVLSLYGVHGIYSTFVRKAKKFRSDIYFDYVLSISTPPSSHQLAHKLLKSKHIHCKHWIQIWEDPWYSDAYGYHGKAKIYREEKRLLGLAESVCYVSPLTLENQKRLFPESADKMYWQPLPFYYKSDCTVCPNSSNKYGYFGDYVPVVRNLEHFYEAAKETGIEVNICGNPSNLLRETETIHIYPRLPLPKLKPIEDSTNVLIFLCNRQGGQIPGKIYQYSATDKTILFILDGTNEEQSVLLDYFGKFNRYVFCQNTVKDIVRAIRDIESKNLNGVENRPVEIFAPSVIIENILKSGS